MIIDFHTHVFPAFFRENRSLAFSGESAFESIYNSSKAKLAGTRELLDDMNKEGVHRSVIFGFPWDKEENYRRHNDYIIESVIQNPERLTGFCCFSPFSPGAPKEVERCLEAGLSGVGEIAIYGSGISPETIEGLKEIMSLCARFDAPFMLHTNEPVGHEYPGKAPMTLRQIYRFVKRYPENRIILAHWGGGLFFFSLMKKEVRDVLNNVWLDTAASPFLYTPDIYRIAGELIGFEKILFGSDYPLIKPKRYFKEMKSAGLASASIDRIIGLNAAQVLGLSA